MSTLAKVAEKNQEKLNALKAQINTCKLEMEEKVKEIDKDEDGVYKLDIDSKVFGEVDAIKTNYEKAVKERDVMAFLINDINSGNAEKHIEIMMGGTPENKLKSLSEAIKAGVKGGKYCKGSVHVGEDILDLAIKYEMQVTGTYNSGTGPAGMFLQPERLAEYIPTFQGILNAWTSGLEPTNADWIQAIYIAEFFEHNNAAITAEKIALPQSDFATKEININLVNIGHYFDLTRQQVDGVAGAENNIRRRGLQMLLTKINNAFLNSTDTNMKGLYNTVGLTTTSITGLNYLDSVLNGIITAMGVGVSTSHILVHQTKWGTISQLKDGQGRYLLCDPGNGGAKSLWGIPIVPDSQATTTKTLLVDLMVNIEKYMYGNAIRVDATNSDQDKFIKNLITILMSAQIGVAVYRPAGTVVLTD